MPHLLSAVGFFALVLGGASSERAAPSADSRYAGAIEVRHFDFEQDEDADYDGLPDDWSRVTGAGYPNYIKSDIDRAVRRSGEHSLRFDADGGNVTLLSPPLPIDSQQSYVLKGTLRTQGLEHDWATLTLTFLDSLERPVAEVECSRVSGTTDWTEVQLGPIIPSNPAARFLVVGCHLHHGSRLDLGGAAWFDDLWIGRLPRMVLTFAGDEHFFMSTDRPVAECRLSGFERQDLRVEMTLTDAFGHVLDRTQYEIEPTRPQSGFVRQGRLETEPPGDTPRGPIGRNPAEVRWLIPSQQAGFYRVTASLLRGDETLLVDSTTMAIIAPTPARPTGEFGWTLERIPGEIELSELADLAARARINWLKFPLWSLDGESEAASRDFMSFVERLDRNGIALVGLLKDPPAEVRQHLSRQSPGVSEVFRLGPEVWYPSLEPVLANYALRIRWWQLGGEEDRSFIGLDGLESLLQTVKAQLDRVGRDVRLGIPWDWMYEEPATASEHVAFLSLSTDPPLTDTELTAHLSDGKDVARWIALKALPAGAYSTGARATDLARRMVAAKKAGARAIFAADPCNSRSGLFNKDGSPTELFLPWRTLSDALAGADFLGSLVLPEGSENAVFLRDRQLILVVWNDQPTREEVYLGGDPLFGIDLWGRRYDVPLVGGRHVLEVGRQPVCIFGASEALARWRFSVAFGQGRIPSQVGNHEETVRFQNTFAQGVSGRASLVLPDGWSAEPADWDFQLGAEETMEQKVVIRLPWGASQGKQRVAVRFELEADRRHRFDVYRPYKLGTGDVQLEVLSNLTPDGQLEVEQRITNNTDEVLTFECLLEAPRRKRKKTMVIKLGRGRDTKFYLLPNGEELLGKTLSLRAKQVEGRRVLNRLFVVGQ